MNKSKEKGISRRNFLKNTTKTTVVIAGCLKIGLRDALALAMATGKPVATEKNVNAFIQEATSIKGSYARIVKEASTDLRSFVKSNFTLTPEYEKNFGALPNSEIERFQKVIAQSISEKSIVRIWYLEKGKSVTKGVTIKACLKVGWGEICITYSTVSKAI
jgi:hypothetical protein